MSESERESEKDQRNSERDQRNFSLSFSLSLAVNGSLQLRKGELQVPTLSLRIPISVVSPIPFTTNTQLHTILGVVTR